MSLIGQEQKLEATDNVPDSSHRQCLSIRGNCQVKAMTTGASHARIAFLSVSVGLFLICLACDGYYVEGPNPRAWAPAIGLLLLGWIGLLYGTFAWLGNPLILIAAVMFWRRRYRWAIAFSAVALMLMLSFLLVRTVVSSEAPTFSRVTGYGLGYWLWIASASVLLGGSLWGSAVERSLSPSADAP